MKVKLKMIDSFDKIELEQKNGGQK